MKRYMKKWHLVIITLLIMIGIAVVIWFFTRPQAQQEFQGTFIEGVVTYRHIH